MCGFICPLCVDCFDDDKRRDIRTNKSLFFIFLCEFLQRFAFYGVYAMMFLFLRHELGLAVHTAIALVHVYAMVYHLCPMLGALLADTSLGTCNSVFLISAVSLLGDLLLFLAAAVDWMGITGDDRHWFMGSMCLPGFLLHVIGAGMQPVATFYREQHNDGEPLTAHFFLVLYNCMSLAVILGALATPALRMSLVCSELPYCYPASFAVCLLAVVMGIVVLLLGTPMYNPGQSSRSPIADTLQCIRLACACASKKDGADWSDGRDESAVKDVRQTMHALWLFLPLPIFWALFEQMWSRWIYQATSLNGELLSTDLAMEPDSMPALNPLLLVVMLPAYETLFVPLCTVTSPSRTPRARLFVGGLMAVLAFSAAAILQLNIESLPAETVPPDHGTLHFFSASSPDCTMNVTSTISGHEHFQVVGEQKHSFHLRIDDTLHFDVVNRGCQYKSEIVRFLHLFRYEKQESARAVSWTAKEGEATSYLVDVYDGDEQPVELHGSKRRKRPRTDQARQLLPFTDYRKSELQLAKVGIMYVFIHPHVPASKTAVAFNVVQLSHWHELPHRQYVLDLDKNAVDFELWPARPYKMQQAGSRRHATSVHPRRGGIYMIWFKVVDDQPMVMEMSEIEPPSSISIWWQFFQYLLITLAQWMLPVAMLDYANTQVNQRMHSFLLLCWYLTIAAGDLIVAILSVSNIFEREMYSYMMYMVLMLVDLLVLTGVLLSYEDKTGEVEEIGPGGSVRSTQSAERRLHAGTFWNMFRRRRPGTVIEKI